MENTKIQWLKHSGGHIVAHISDPSDNSPADYTLDIHALFFLAMAEPMEILQALLLVQGNLHTFGLTKEQAAAANLKLEKLILKYRVAYLPD